MPEHQSLSQIEFRWQPGKDFSPIASSFADAAASQRWFARLAGLVRPATPDPARGVPSRSAAYWAFPDGTAALIWRRYEVGATALHAETSRRPLVARAVVGATELLRPDAAIALIRADPLAELSPLPGQVETGAELPPIPAGGLPELTRSSLRALDERSYQDLGLETLVAAALRTCGTPLSVVLPGSEMAQPAETSPQLGLLWGLWRTTAHLIAGAADAGPLLRLWSFSTYEPPLGDTGTADLAHVVFRSQEQERQPQTMRAEITVKPRYRAAGWDQFNAVASVLADAYRDLGGSELCRCLSWIADRHRTLPERLSAAIRQLGWP